MKVSRRQLIIGSLVLGGGMATIGLGRLYNAYRTPDFTELDRHISDLESLIDAIIPSSDTSPGAIEAGVISYLRQAVSSSLRRSSQNNFIDGFNQLRSDCNTKLKKSLGSCSLEERVQLLTDLENEAGDAGTFLTKAKSRLVGEEFIHALKRLTIWGYCTSELGATKGLTYDYIPGRYTGVTSITTGQKSWATI